MFMYDCTSRSLHLSGWLKSAYNILSVQLHKRSNFLKMNAKLDCRHISVVMSELITTWALVPTVFIANRSDYNGSCRIALV